MSAYIRYIPVVLGGGSGGGGVTTIGTFDSEGTPSANALTISGGTTLIAQSASATVPGMVNTTAQTFAGVKTLSSAPVLSSLTASTGLQLDSSKNVISATLGTTTEATSSVLTLSGWSNATFGSPTIQVKQAGASQGGYLSSTDWNTFNAKQPSGSYITSLTGDVTASGPGAAAASLVATSNSTLATLSGLTTASSLASVGTITNGTWNATAINSQYGGTGANFSASTGVPTLSSGAWTINATLPNSVFPALTGDVTTTAGSLTTTLATVNSAPGTYTYASITVNGKGLVTAASSGSAPLTNPMTTAGDMIYGGASGAPTRLPIGSAGQALIVSGTTPTWTSPTTTPTASTFAGWDSNENLSANNFLASQTTTATAAGTTVLTVSSNQIQYFTGSTTQTVDLPVASTLQNGHTFWIYNASSGSITVKTSGGNTLATVNTGKFVQCVCINNAGGTGTASWDYFYYSSNTSVNTTGTGGTGTSTAPTAGAVVYGASTTAQGYTAAGTTGQYLISGGTGSPTWHSFSTPTVTRLTSTGTQTGWLFTISTSTTCAVGDTYTNNGNTYTVQGALSAQSGQVLFMSGTGATSGTTLTRSSGSGTSSITFSATLATATYTTPSSPSPIYIEVEAVGGGGGGASGGSTGTGAGNAGTSTFFGANVCIAGGGAGGIASGNAGSNSGGTASVSGATQIVAIAGSGGQGAYNNGTTYAPGGSGGNSPFGGAGGGSVNGNAPNAQANSGSGGGGAGSNSGGNPGTGGAAGGYLRAIISSPGTSYPYAIGAGGTGNTGGSFSGGNGGSGYIGVKEYYQ